MKNKRERYYGRSRSRDKESSGRRRSSRSRRRSRSSKDKSEFRSMTRSRSKERGYGRSRGKRSHSSSSSSTGSSSSSSRSRSRSRKGSPERRYRSSRHPTDKGGFPFNLPPSGQFGGESWFDGNRASNAGNPAAPPPPPGTAFPSTRRTPPAPPPPSLDHPPLPIPPPAPTFDSRPIPSIQNEEPRNFPPSNFSEGNFGNNFQGNFPGSYDSSYYQQGVNVSGYPSGPPASNQPHNFNPAEHQPPNSNWDFPQGGMPPPHGPSTFKAVPDGPPPPLHQSSTEAVEHSKKEAVEQELAQQKRTLAVQREEYFKRKITLTRELTRLKDQKRELLKEDSSVNDRILKENSKLQSEILQKLKSMDHVIEMLSNIIGDKAEIAELMKETSYAIESPKKADKRKRSVSRSPSRSKSKTKSDSPFEKRNEKLVNIIHYDPELHWCSVCEAFPRTALQYLVHLHTEGHKQAVKVKKGKKEEDSMPWRALEPREQSPLKFKNAPSKRVPIRGVQFLVPAAAWYCSLCKMWLGDMEIANRHLRGPKHASNYHDFIGHNPHWEVDWLTERTRAYERNSEAKSKNKTINKEAIEAQKDAAEAGKKKSEPPAPFDITNLGDRLLAMLAASSKSNLITAQKEHKKDKKGKSSSSSSSSSESDSERKKKKKKKKEKKKRKADQSNEQKKGSSKVRNYDEEEKPSEENARFMRKRYAGENDDRNAGAPKKWSDEPPDRHNRDRFGNNRPPYFSKDSRTGSKNVKAGPEFSERDFLGPEKNSSYNSKSEYLKEDSYYGPKPPPRKDDGKMARDKERKLEVEDKRPKGKLYVPGRDDDEDNSARNRKDEKASSKDDSSAKKKESLKPFSISKTKLPFIGRMPILKKKIEPKSADSAANKLEPSDAERNVEPPIPKSKSSNTSANADISTSATDPSLNQDTLAGLPKSTLIISKRPPLTEPEIALKVDNLQEQDMEIEDEPPPPPPPPLPLKDEVQVKEAADESAQGEGNELHKDFKDALDLLFPEQKLEDQPEPEPPVQLTESEQITQSTTSAPPQTYQTNYDMYHQQVAAGYDAMGYYDQTAAYHHHMQQQASYMAAMGYDQTNMNMFSTAVPPPGYNMPPVNASYPPPAMMNSQVAPALPPGVEAFPALPSQGDMPSEYPPQSEYPGGQPQPNSDRELSSSEAADDGAPPKKKNPPGQRLRRHFKKKAMKEAAEAAALKDQQKQGEEETTEDDEVHLEMSPTPRPASKLRPEELSELALLGIEVDDITAQSFY